MQDQTDTFWRELMELTGVSMSGVQFFSRAKRATEVILSKHIHRQTQLLYSTLVAMRSVMDACNWRVRRVLLDLPEDREPTESRVIKELRALLVKTASMCNSSRSPNFRVSCAPLDRLDRGDFMRTLVCTLTVCQTCVV